MNHWIGFWIATTVIVGVIGVGLASSGRPFVGISMTVFSVATAHLNWVHRHD